ncbi:MAG: PIN domain nuclease [Geminicoccaceae bacterium]
MILVDSSVWIDFFRGVDTSGALALREILRQDEVLVGDLILVEVLQGFREEREAAVAADLLDRFDQVAIVDSRIARQAAAHYRQLRRLGITVRKTIDLLIATRCIDKGWWLLHNDRDYEPLREHLGLRVLGD